MDSYSGFAVVFRQKSLIRPGAFPGTALCYPRPTGWAISEPPVQGGWCEPHGAGQPIAPALLWEDECVPPGCPKLHQPPATWSQGQLGSWAASAPRKSCFRVLNSLHENHSVLISRQQRE